MQRQIEHMTHGGGKFDPQHPTGKDRFREALMAGLLGAAQGAAQTGDWHVEWWAAVVPSAHSLRKQHVQCHQEPQRQR
ncbi:MAG: hypothetical protein U0Y68_20725 [Blastocatellia bacterium]